MGFGARLARIRQEKQLGVPELARLTAIHATQLRRYEKEESQPTLDALRKLVAVLNVPGDTLLFDEDERKPPKDFLLQFEALMQLDEEDKKSVRALIDGLVIRSHAKKLMKDRTG